MSLILIIIACMAGCSSVKFYSQAIHGQMEILTKARPIAEVVGDEHIPNATREKLALVQEMRRFAGEQLGLPANRQYQRFTDLGRRYVVWVVYAAPEFSVEGKTWSYPFVGTLEYRGFFSEEAAKEEKDRLKAEGYDVFMGGVEAYSTLGWFRDPILNTFLHRSDEELAELIFHELTHVKLFLPGDTDFNEAFATANAEAGVRRWLIARGDRPGLAAYDKALARDREAVRLILRTRETLKRLYSDGFRTPEEMRLKKAAVIAEMRLEYAALRRRWGENPRDDRKFAHPWNNARLNTVATYYDLVPGLERLLERNNGDLASFYAAVEKLRHLSKEERRAALKEQREPSASWAGSAIQ